jgi:DNA-binding NarL/FixJ family response regulator
MEPDQHVEPKRAPVTGIFIVTPIKLYREGIAHFLRSSDRFAVLGTAEESGGMIARAHELLPDVILLDMAFEDSRATARALREALPHTSIVALAIPDSEEHVLDCAEAGISGYVSREGSLDELLATVVRVTNGEVVCSPRIAAGLFRRVASLSTRVQNGYPPHLPAATLTPRETEVIELINEGFSNKEIARRLYIEVPTVKNHVHSILEKLGARSRSEAAAHARRLSLTRH